MNVKKNILIFVGICLSLSACQATDPTPYKHCEDGFGYSSNRVTHSLVVVNFIGYRDTSYATAKKFALFRAADYAKKQGKPAFLLYRNLLQAAADRPGNEPTVGVFGDYITATAYVYLLDEYRPNAFRTDEVLKEKDRVIPADQGLVTEQGGGNE